MKVLKFGGSSVEVRLASRRELKIVVNSDRNNGRIAVLYSLPSRELRTL